MDVLIVCPANCATGGPEALHAFASKLNTVKGMHARLWYWNATSSQPMPEEYASYGCEYVTELPAGYNGVIVYPEIWANHVLDYPQCINSIYWLGVDAYASWNPHDCGAFLKDDSVIHIAQSEYAYDFLRKLKVRHLYKCVDIVNADFYADHDGHDRSDVVLYNPAKMTPFMRKLMDACSGIEFKAIQNMTRAEVIDAMRHAKLYLDFGEFPGRERIPREAALCGCCLITSKVGSADYYEDFKHYSKYDSKDGHIWAIVNRIRYVLDNYDECAKEFGRFRIDLREDIERLDWQIEVIAHVFQHHHSRA